MRSIVRSDLMEEYEIFEYYEAEPGQDCLHFDDRFFTRQFLSGFLNDYFAMTTFRNIIHQGMGYADLTSMSDHQVLDRIADELISGRLKMIRRQIPMLGEWLPVKPETEDQVSKDQEAQPALSWIQVKVVDDVTGAVIPRVKLSFKFSNGEQRELSSGLKGVIDLRDIPAGRCEVGCDIKGMRLDNAIHFVTMGEAASGKKLDWEEELVGKTEGQALHGTRIANIEGRKVKAGDSLDSLAKQAGMTAAELAEFNWGTRNPTIANQRMGHFLGCTKRDAEGRAYVLDDSDDPGFIFLPKPWSQQLETAQAHVIRVKQVGYYLRFNYHINVDDPENQDDTISLQTVDGSWKHTIEVGSLEEVGPDWVELVFPMPPSGMSYALIQDPKDGQEPFVIFQGAEEDALYPGMWMPEKHEAEKEEVEDEDFWDLD